MLSRSEKPLADAAGQTIQYRSLTGALVTVRVESGTADSAELIAAAEEATGEFSQRARPRAKPIPPRGYDPAAVFRSWAFPGGSTDEL